MMAGTISVVRLHLSLRWRVLIAFGAGLGLVWGNGPLFDVMAENEGPGWFPQSVGILVWAVYAATAIMDVVPFALGLGMTRAACYAGTVVFMVARPGFCAAMGDGPLRGPKNPVYSARGERAAGTWRSAGPARRLVLAATAAQRGRPGQRRRFDAGPSAAVRRAPHRGRRRPGRSRLVESRPTADLAAYGCFGDRAGRVDGTDHCERVPGPAADRCLTGPRSWSEILSHAARPLPSRSPDRTSAPHTAGASRP